MEEKRGLGSRIADWFRQRLNRDPQESISVKIEEDFKAALLDPAEDEYFYPDNFISENNYIYQDQKIPEVFDNVIVDLATDIEDYLNTYASLPLLPFGAVEENREAWIQAFIKDLLTNHGEWCRREIYEALTSLRNMESPEIKEDTQKLLVRIEQLEVEVNALVAEPIELEPSTLSYPFSNLGNDECSYAKVAMDKYLFQDLFGEEQVDYYETHDAYIRCEEGELSKILMDRATKEIIHDSSLANISKESLTACAEAMKYMKIYANCDMASVVSAGKPLDSAKNEYSVKQGLSNYFKKPNQNLVMSVNMQPSYETQHFIALNEDKLLDIPSVQAVIPTLYEEHDVRGVLAGIAELPGIKVNDPYNILGKNIYLSQEEICNQFIRNATPPTASMIKNMDLLNRAVGFNCNMDDVAKLAKGKKPEGSCPDRVSDKARDLAGEIKNEVDAKEKMMINEPIVQQDTFVGADIVL